MQETIPGDYFCKSFHYRNWKVNQNVLGFNDDEDFTHIYICTTENEDVYSYIKSWYHKIMWERKATFAVTWRTFTFFAYVCFMHVLWMFMWIHSQVYQKIWLNYESFSVQLPWKFWYLHSVCLKCILQLFKSVQISSKLKPSRFK